MAALSEAALEERSLECVGVRIGGCGVDAERGEQAGGREREEERGERRRKRDQLPLPRDESKDKATHICDKSLTSATPVVLVISLVSALYLFSSRSISSAT